MAKNDIIRALELESLTPKWHDIADLKSGQGLEWCKDFSQLVLKKLMSNQDFILCEPIILGSLARDELCPQSDLDFVFLGAEEKVKIWMQWAQEKGLKVRARVPIDKNDLSVGVETWDFLSLIDGKAFTKSAKEILHSEQKKILKSKKTQKKIWLKKIHKDREQRSNIWDSLETLLEPQLKLGRGGIRDLYQSRLIIKLMSSEDSRIDEYVVKVFNEALKIFLSVRIFLHLHNQSDRVSSHIQSELAAAMNFDNYQDFMRILVKEFSRVSFYSEWLLETYIKPLYTMNSSRPQTALKLIISNPSLQAQYIIRRKLNDIFPNKLSRQKKLFFLSQLIHNPKLSEKNLEAIFRSRLTDRLLPEMKPLIGHVQHDQYHRWTADAHILSVLKEVVRLRDKKNKSDWSDVTKKLNKSDWLILLWCALYHDLAKARKTDHSRLGCQWSLRDLKLNSITNKMATEVAWLVKNHLLFSNAAFRKDLSDPNTIKHLYKFDLNDKRIIRLLVFTMLDIRGSNPDSWSNWKSKLLLELGDKLLHSAKLVKDQNEVIKFFDKNKKVSQFIHDLDTQSKDSIFEIAKNIGMNALKKDIAEITKKTRPKSFVAIQRGRHTWIRFHSIKDEKGILSTVLGIFFQAGISVLQANVITSKSFGVYDWFCVEKIPQKSINMIESLFDHGIKLSDPPKIKWDSIEVIEKKGALSLVRWVALDQRGLLWAAAELCFKADLSIHYVQAQTWGKRVEDLFWVKGKNINNLKEIAEKV